MVRLALGCAIVLLSGCRGSNGAATDADGSSAAIDAGESDAIVSCSAGQGCPPGRICVPDPRATCTAGTPCPSVCFSGSRLCFDLMPSDGGPTTDCPPGQYVVTCRPNSCEGRNECNACIDGTGATCDPANPCPAGQLCIPVRACANATDCGGVCAVP